MEMPKVYKPGDRWTDEMGDVVVNKYGFPMHDAHWPFIDIYEDTRMTLNPDIKKVNEILQKIHDNNGYCPSKEFDGNREAFKPDNRCPCPDFLMNGKCECGLFIPIPYETKHLDPKMLESLKRMEE